MMITCLCGAELAPINPDPARTEPETITCPTCGTVVTITNDPAGASHGVEFTGVYVDPNQPPAA